MSSVSTYIYAFIICGLLCVVAQLLIDKTALTPARILVIYVSAGVFMGAVGLQSVLEKIAGCGVTVPLTGFGANIAAGIKKAIESDGFLGIFRGGFTAAAAGCCAALVFGYIAALLFSGKRKN